MEDNRPTGQDSNYNSNLKSVYDKLTSNGSSGTYDEFETYFNESDANRRAVYDRLTTLGSSGTYDEFLSFAGYPQRDIMANEEVPAQYRDAYSGMSDALKGLMTPVMRRREESMQTPEGRTEWATELRNVSRDMPRQVRERMTREADDLEAYNNNGVADVAQMRRVNEAASMPTTEDVERESTLRTPLGTPVAANYTSEERVNASNSASARNEARRRQERQVRSIDGMAVSMGLPTSYENTTDVYASARAMFDSTPDGAAISQQLSNAISSDLLVFLDAKKRGDDAELKEVASLFDRNADPRRIAQKYQRLEESGAIQRFYDAFNEYLATDDAAAKGVSLEYDRQLNEVFGGWMAEKGLPYKMEIARESANKLNEELVRRQRENQSRMPGSSFMRYGTAGVQMNQQPRELEVAQQYMQKTDALISNYADGMWGNSLLKGFGDTIADIDFWTFGMNEVARGLFSKNIMDKVGEDMSGYDSLTDDEKLCFDAIAQYYMTQQLFRPNGWYKGGQITAEAIPFIVMMMGSGAIAEGAGKAMANSPRAWMRSMSKLLPQAEERATLGTLGRNMERITMKEFFARELPQAVGRMATSGIIYSGTTGLPNTVATAIEYMMPEFKDEKDRSTLYVDEQEGKVKASGMRSSDDNWASAIAKGFGMQAIEGASEALSEFALEPATRYLGARFMAGIGKNGERYFSNIARVALKDANIMGSASRLLSGPLNEYTEEIFGSFMRCITGLSTWGEEFNSQQLAETAFGLAPMEAVFSIIGGTGIARHHRRMGRAKTMIEEYAPNSMELYDRVSRLSTYEGQDVLDKEMIEILETARMWQEQGLFNDAEQKEIAARMNAALTMKEQLYMDEAAATMREEAKRNAYETYTQNLNRDNGNLVIADYTDKDGNTRTVFVVGKNKDGEDILSDGKKRFTANGNVEVKLEYTPQELDNLIIGKVGEMVDGRMEQVNPVAGETYDLVGGPVTVENVDEDGYVTVNMNGRSTDMSRRQFSSMVTASRDAIANGIGAVDVLLGKAEGDSRILANSDNPTEHSAVGAETRAARRTLASLVGEARMRELESMDKEQLGRAWAEADDATRVLMRSWLVMRGDDAYRNAMQERRAQVVVDFRRKIGKPAYGNSYVTTAAYGDSLVIVDNTDGQQAVIVDMQGNKSIVDASLLSNMQENDLDSFAAQATAQDQASLSALEQAYNGLVFGPGVYTIADNASGKANTAVVVSENQDGTITYATEYNIDQKTDEVHHEGRSEKTVTREEFRDMIEETAAKQGVKKAQQAALAKRSNDIGKLRNGQGVTIMQNGRIISGVLNMPYTGGQSVIIDGGGVITFDTMDDLKKAMVEADDAVNAEFQARVEQVSNRLNELASVMPRANIRIVTNEDQLDEDPRQKVKNGAKLDGYFDPNTNTVVFYVPGMIEAGNDPDVKFIHEVIVHYGLSNMLGKEEYKALCLNIFNTVMNDEQKKQYVQYVRESHPNLTDPTQIMAMAADEYLAFTYENRDVDAIERKNLLERIIDAIMRLFQGNGVQMDRAKVEAALDQLIAESRDWLRGEQVREQEQTQNTQHEQPQMSREERLRVETEKTLRYLEQGDNSYINQRIKNAKAKKRAADKKTPTELDDDAVRTEQIKAINAEKKAADDELKFWNDVKAAVDAVLAEGNARVEEANQALAELEQNLNPTVEAEGVHKFDKEPGNAEEAAADYLVGFVKKQHRINEDSLIQEGNFGNNEVKNFRPATTPNGGISLSDAAQALYEEYESEGHEHGWFSDPQDAMNMLLSVMRETGSYGELANYINNRRGNDAATQQMQAALDANAQQLGYEDAQDMHDKRMAEAQAKLQELKDEQGGISNEALRQFKDFTQSLMVGQEEQGEFGVGNGNTEYFGDNNDEPLPFSVALPVDQQTPKNTTIDQVLYSIKVNHNSPYLLKKADGAFVDPETGETLGFDHRFMNTGEGTQVHGWGSYFSVNDLRGYAGDPLYTMKYKGNVVAFSNLNRLAMSLIQHFNGDINALRKEIEAQIKIAESKGLDFVYDYDFNHISIAKAREAVEQLSRPEDFEFDRHHYDVEIPDNNGENYIEESEKPSDEMLDRIINGLKERGVPSDLADGIKKGMHYKVNRTGRYVYDRIADMILPTANNFKQASEFLHDIGFTGIHYDGRQDGECYVIFDENDAKIVDHVRFSMTPEEIERYDKENGLELGDFLDSLGKPLPKDKAHKHFRVAKTGELLNRYGIIGDVTIGQKARNPKRHTSNAWHQLSRENWVDVIGNINNPIAITKYNGKDNSFRIYTNALLNGRNICVGVDVNRVGNEVFVSDIVTAFGRNISSIIDSANEKLLYPSEDKLKQMAGQFSSAQSSQGYAQPSVSDANLQQKFEPAIENEEKVSGYPLYSVITDPQLIEQLEQSDKEIGFRTIALNPDGTLGSPMAGKLGKKGEKSKATTPFEIGKWEKADENPDMATEDGKIDLVKPQGRGTVGRVDYNPYIHIRPDAINTQFTQAWMRPELVYIETEYPTSELTSGYHADKAKLTTGRHEWNGGDLILSRYDKPVRIVPWDEVADRWAERFRDTGVTFDIVAPEMLPLLAERGIEILPPKKAAGQKAMDAYNQWKNGGKTMFSMITPEQDAAYMRAVESGDMETAQRMVREAAAATMPESVVLDRDDLPKKVLHGTNSEFNIFDERKIGSGTDAGWLGRGFYFYGNAPEYASQYGKRIIGAYLNIENPYFASVEDMDRLAEANSLEASVEFRQELEDEGYDGVFYNGDLNEEWVAFYPNQIKSADPVTYDDQGNVIPLSQRFNKSSDDIRFSVANANQAIFVSNAEKAVEGIKQEKATPEQWLKMIEKNGGLKAGEDKWLGLSQWLKDSEAKTLTKQEVLDFINENAIKIEEVRYDEDADTNFAEYQADYEDFYNEERENGSNDPEQSAWQRMIDKYGDDIGLGFYPDGSILRINDDSSYINWLSDTQGLGRPINSTRLQYTTNGLIDKREIALTVPTIEPWNESDEIHFGDAGEGRAVAWIRFGETTTERELTDEERSEIMPPADKWEKVDGSNFINKHDIYYYPGTRNQSYNSYIVDIGDGMFEIQGPIVRRIGSSRYPSLENAVNAFNRQYAKDRGLKKEKVLVIDEIQSKRHQEGREKGYEHYLPISGVHAGEYVKVKDEKYADRISFAEVTDDRDIPIGQIEKIDGKYRPIASNGQQIGFKDFDTEQEALDAVAKDYTRVEGIPSAPFEKNWMELAMKRMLRLAAEEGYDKVAWTTGEQQADRYNLSKVFSSIEREDNPSAEGRRFVFGGDNVETFFVDDNGKVIDATITEAIGKDLSEVVGKDMAEKIMTMNDGDVLDEEDMRIGGEGMNAFYDKMIPSFMNKYCKQWGVKVGEVTMPQLEEGYETMHSVDVNDEMKQSVMEGQLMFSLNGTHVVPLGDNTLVGMHNISGEKLRKALKTGGLANPSAAVIDLASQNHFGYGEISLIMPSDMVDATTGRNAGTYAGDAYTPMYPTVQYRAGKETDKRIKEFLKGLPEDLAYRIERGIKDLMDGNSYNSGLEYLFLKEKGQEPAIVKNERRYPDITMDSVKERLGLPKDANFDQLWEAYEKLEGQELIDFNIWLNKYGNQEKADEVRRMMEKDERIKNLLEKQYGERLGFGQFDGSLNRIKSDEREAGKDNLDDTFYEANKIVNSTPELRKEYDEWKRKVVDGFGYDEVIFNGYTPSGYRRYLPNTVENASRVMNRNDNTNWLGQAGVNEAKSMLLDKFRTLNQIRKNRGLLEGDNERIKQAYEEVQNDYSQLGWDFMNYTFEHKEAYGLDDNKFIAHDNALNRIQEAMTQSDPIAYLNREYRYKLEKDSEFAKRIKEMKDRIKSLPSRYFETKFKRPVYIDEFASAVVPNDLSPDLYDALQNAGLDMFEYDPKNQDSRREATIKASDADGIRFSFVGRQGAQRLDMAERAMTRLNDLHTARQMEEQGKDAKAIKLATGWERGKDGKWRFELPDFYKAKETANKLIQERADHYNDIYKKDRDLYRRYEILDSQIPVRLDKRFTEEQKEKFREMRKQRDEIWKEYIKNGAELSNLETQAAVFHSTLGEMMDEDSPLLIAYPQLKDVKVDIVEIPDQNTRGDYNSSTNTIRINYNADADSYNEILAHEVQHAIQSIEGFAQGGNPAYAWQAVKDMENNAKIWGYKLELDDVAKDFPQHTDSEQELLYDILFDRLKYENDGQAEYNAVRDGWIPEENLRKQAYKIFKGRINGDAYEKAYNQYYDKLRENGTQYYNGTPYELYKRLVGEVEARNVSKRLSFTDEQRRAILAEETEDIAREDQLIILAGDPILYSVASAASTPQERMAFYDALVGDKSETSTFVGRTMENAYRTIVDGAIPLKRLQEVIAGRGKVKDEENAYLMEIARSSRAKYLTDQADEKFYQPMIRAIAALTGKQTKRGFNKAMRDVELYVLAKSGLERNAWFWNEEKKKDPNAPLKDKSGLTSLAAQFGEKDFTAFAEKLVADYERRHDKKKVDALWDSIRNMSHNILDIEAEGLLISTDLADNLKKRWQFYVPMRGFDDTVTSSVYSYDPSSAEIRFQNPFKKIRGRVSLADNPFVNLWRMTESAINLKGKNEVGIALLTLASNHSDNGLLRIGQSWEVKLINPNTAEEEWQMAYPEFKNVNQKDIPAAIDAFQKQMLRMAKTGDARPSSRTAGGMRIFPTDMDQHTLKVTVAGQTVDLYLMGSPKAFQALAPRGKNGLAQALSGVTRFLSGLMTTYNPVFMVRNSIRDLKTSMIITYTRDGAAGMGNMLGQWFGNSIRLGRLIAGKSSGDATIDQYWNEFLEFGGETGFTRSLNMEKSREEFMKAMRNETRRGINPNGVLKAYGNFMENYGNRYAEDITRFAVFCASRKMGKSAMQAASDAKNTTANFNKKGNSAFARFMTSCYAFFNAAIQGLNTTFHAYKDNPGRAAVASLSTVAYSMAVPFINLILLSMFGDDDDWRQYENMTPFVGNTHLIIYIPKSGFLTLPYPQDFVPLTALGNIIWRNAAGMTNTDSERSIAGNIMMEWADTMADLMPVNMFEEGFGKIGDWDGVARALAPTWLAPVSDVMLNRNYMGSQIRRKHFTAYGQRDLKPYWAEYDREKSHWAYDIARLIAGGDEYRAAAEWRNIDPRQIIHIVEGYGGGSIKLLSDTFNYVVAAAKGEHPSINQCPFIKKFWIQPQPDKYEGNLNGKLYDMMYHWRDMDNEIKSLQKEMRRAQDDGNTQAAEQRQRAIDEIVNSEEYKLLSKYDIKNMMENWRDSRNAIAADDTMSSDGKQEAIRDLTYEKASFLDGIWEELYLNGDKSNWFSEFYYEKKQNARNRKENE